MTTAQSVHYLYLDDGQLDESKTFAQSVERNTSGLTIEVSFPIDFSDQIRDIEQVMGNKNGLILDLRLDQQANNIDGIPVRASYRAPALAQEIRTRATEVLIGEFPIILWSFERRLSESYSRDQTSQDLFDITIKKEKLMSQGMAKEIGQKMISLSQDYPRIESIRDSSNGMTGWFHTMLGFSSLEEASFLDSRILENFDGAAVKRPAHEYAFFICRHLLDTPGPLLSKQTLAARMGIDIHKSSDAENLFSNTFNDAKYKGVFSSGWSRWWGHLVDMTWHNLVGNKKNLRSLTAIERVQLLRDTTGLQHLEPAEPIKSEYSSRFWTTCWGTQKPLDPRNGFLLTRKKSYPWQEENLVSLEAFEEGDINLSDVDPVDRQRLARLLGLS